MQKEVKLKLTLARISKGVICKMFDRSLSCTCKETDCMQSGSRLLNPEAEMFIRHYERGKQRKPRAKNRLLKTIEVSAL